MGDPIPFLVVVVVVVVVGGGGGDNTMQKNTSIEDLQQLVLTNFRAPPHSFNETLF